MSKLIPLALGLANDATEADVLETITTLKADKKTAEDKLSTFEAAQKTANDKEATTLINNAVTALKLTGEAKTNFINTYKALFSADHENAKAAILTVTPKQEDNSANLGNFLKDIDGTPVGDDDPKLCFDYLQKHAPTGSKSSSPQTRTIPKASR